MKRLSIPYLPELNELSAEMASGMIDESGHKFSVETLNWPQKFNYRPLTTVSIARSLSAIHLFFQVHSNCLRAVHTKDNQPVNEDSCVEFFVKKTDSNYYYNFEFNCIGACKAARHFKNRQNSIDFLPEHLKQIDRWSSLGKRAFNELAGLFNWDLCVSIPFILIDIDPGNLPEKLLGNFYNCADATEQPYYVSWSPIETEKPDFHRPDFFGELYLKNSGPDKI